MRPLLVLATALLLLALPSPASAASRDGEAAPRTRISANAAGLVDTDPLFHTSFDVTLTCIALDPPAADGAASAPRCTQELTLTAIAADPWNDWKESGQPVVLTVAPVDLAVGETTKLTLQTPVGKLRDTFLGTALTGAILKLRTPVATDRSLAEVGVQQPLERIGRPACVLPTWVAYRAAKPAMQQYTSETGSRFASSPHRDLKTSGVELRAMSATTFSLHGLTYTASAGSRFSFTCGAINAVTTTNLYPTIMLTTGSIRVTGRPTGRHQLAALIATDEAGLGNRAQERVDFTVARDARRKVATIRMRVGRTGGITPRDSDAVSPCTSGSSLRIDHRGRITRV